MKRPSVISDMFFFRKYPHTYESKECLGCAKHIAVDVQDFAAEHYEKIMASNDADMQRQLKEMVVKARVDAEIELLKELRDKWAYESAAGHPVMALRLEKWIEICREKGITDNWWELRLD